MNINERINEKSEDCMRTGCSDIYVDLEPFVWISVGSSPLPPHHLVLCRGHEIEMIQCIRSGVIGGSCIEEWLHVHYLLWETVASVGFLIIQDLFIIIKTI